MAFPLLSSGNYGYPKEQAFRIAVDTITQYVMEHDLTVYLVLYDRHPPRHPGQPAVWKA